MKQLKTLSILGVLIAAFGAQTVAQELPVVTVFARNYKYLKSIDSKEAAQPVRLLEHRAAAYDVRYTGYYEDEYDSYSVSFYLPSGYVLAVYDSTGRLLNTAERFKNVALPITVRKAVATRYPNWGITKDIYKVQYEDAKEPRMVYKLTLQNGNKRLRVKTNEKGEFLN